MAIAPVVTRADILRREAARPGQPEHVRDACLAGARALDDIEEAKRRARQEDDTARVQLEPAWKGER
jgi:hypothetical protein